MRYVDDSYYASPRWSYEILDCAMPMTFDTYSNCAHQCAYCFAYFQRAANINSAEAYLAHKVKAVNIDHVKRMFLQPDEHAGQFAWYIKRRMVLQWGGLSDGFDWYERKLRKSLELLRFFREIDYPISISTKGVWFLEDPEYLEAIEGGKNVHWKYSIITLDPQKAKKLEAGTPTPQARYEALRKLKELGCATTLRFRPYVLGVSEHDADEMIDLAKEVGVDSVTTEFLSIEKRATNTARQRYEIISDVCGFDIYPFYVQNSYSGSGLLRLNYDIKREHIHAMKARCDMHGIPFFVSDAHHKEASAGAGCCGLPSEGPLSNYNRGQYSEAIQIAKQNGRVYWSDIAVLAEDLKNIPYGGAVGFNQGSTQGRAANRYLTMFDYMRNMWNNTKSWASPARYFGGALVPAGTDEHGDVIYLYNKPYIELGERVESVAELQQRLSSDKEKLREDGGAAGHVAFPIFIPTKGRAGRATITQVLDESKLQYTLVVEPQEVEDYKAAYPNADLMILAESDQGITYARQAILDYCREEGISWYWQIDDNISGFRASNEKVTARAALSAAEPYVGDYTNLALVGLDYQQFAFRQEKPFTVNTRAFCCVLTRTDTGIDYRPETEMKEDVDFTLQHLDTGRWATLLVHHHAMDKPPMGQNKHGGLVEQYQSKQHEMAARVLCAMWPDYTDLVNKRIGLDAQVSWSSFKHPLQLAGLHDSAEPVDEAAMQTA